MGNPIKKNAKKAVAATTARITLITATALAGCSGGGGGGSSLPPPASIGQPTTNTGTGTKPNPAPLPTLPPATSASFTVSGTVTSIPTGTYGAGAPQSPLAGAIVVVGPAPVLGPTPSPNVPAGDVSTMTDGNGGFSAIVATAAAPPPAQTFLMPNQNVFGVSVPAAGYFVSIFARGSDGASAGAQLPNHSFVGVVNGSLGVLRSTVASSDEAGWLALLNRDRAAHGKAPQTFDEMDEEAAREHVADMTTMGVGACHYDAHDRGPDTRYLMLGGLYADSESVGIYGRSSNSGDAGTTTSTWYPQLEAAFWAEGPGGGHYQQMDGPYQWAGTAVGEAPWGPSGQNGFFLAGDIESTATTYTSPVSGTYGAHPGDCAPGIVANGS